MIQSTLLYPVEAAAFVTTTGKNLPVPHWGYLRSNILWKIFLSYGEPKTDILTKTIKYPFHRTLYYSIKPKRTYMSNYYFNFVDAA